MRTEPPAFDPQQPLAWAEAQDRRTDEFLEACEALPRCREFLLPELFRIDPPWRCRRGEHLFSLRFAQGSQPELCIESPQRPRQRLFDPNPQVLDPDHMAVSPSGRYVAFGLGPAGAPLVTLQVLDVASGALVETQPCPGAQPHPRWLPDESGFVYSVCRKPFTEESGPQDGLYLHRLGEDWSADRLIAPYGDGRGHIMLGELAGGSHLLRITHHFSSGLSGVDYVPLDDLGASPVMFFDEASAYVSYLGCRGGWWYFHSCADAPRGHILAWHPQGPGQWREVVPQDELALARPERPDAPAKHAVNDDALLLTYLQDAREILRCHDHDGRRLDECQPPQPSTITAVRADDTEFEILAESFVSPCDEYRYRPGGALRAMPGTSPSPLEVADVGIEQHFCSAADGTRIPYSVLRPRQRQAGPLPTLLYGYGGFNQSLTPSFRPEAALWIALGGAYAEANIRGGGEYGRAWHAAGSGRNKQTSFDDFYAVAEDLIASGISDAHSLTARGLSNGGLLTAVCANQRPELFVGLVSEVPLTDLMALGDTAVGQAIATEFGNPATDPEARTVIAAYSPRQNLRPGGPPQLVVVAAQDANVPPAQAIEYVAARQAAEAGRDVPVLLRLLRDEGHSGWRPETRQRVLAEEVAFLWWCVGRGGATD